MRKAEQFVLRIIFSRKREQSNVRRPNPKLIIFISLLIPYLYIFPHWVDWNQNSRFDLTAAIVERGTLSIDAYLHNTGDYALFNNHAYTDKAPGLSLIAVPIYAIIHPLTQIDFVQALITQLGHAPAAAATINRSIDHISTSEFVFAANITLTTWLTVALPTALLGLIMFSYLEKLGHSARARIISILIYGLATPVFAYSATFYGHQPAAIMLFAAFAWLHRQRTRSLRGAGLFGAGLLLGGAVITEYPAILIAAIIFIYGIWIVRRIEQLLKIILGGLAPLLLLGLYNTTIFGSPFTLTYQYVADPRLQTLVNTGFLSANLPTLEALWGLTFSPYRGLFFMSPILLLAIIGFAWLVRRSTFRAEWLASLSIVVLFLVLVSSSIQWFGGYAAGPRYLVPMLPFLVWPLAATIDRVERVRPSKRSWLRFMIFALVAISIIITWSLTIGGQVYTPDDVQNPLVEYSWPHIISGDVARNVGMLIIGLRSAWSILPLILIVCAAFMLAWHSSSRVSSGA
jgi:hypothetical protein